MRLRLFGPLRLEPAEGAPIVLPWQRPAALLAMLACADGWLAREQLATRLRPDADPETSRAYLRRLLHRARALWPAAGEALEVEPARLRWAGGSDVRDFRAAAAAGRLDEALALHEAELLAGAPPLGDAGIDDWLDDERLALRRRAREVAMAAIEAALAAAGAAVGPGTAAAAPSSTLAGATTLMQRLVDDDPLDEELVQWVLAHAVTDAQQRLALAAHETLSRGLALEMALKPLQATEALADALRARRLAALAQLGGRPGAAATGGPAAPAPPAAVVPDTSEGKHPAAPRAPDAAHRVAPAPGRLFGRTDELAALGTLLARADLRLVTLLGAGGAGKTRLAREFAHREGGRWRDGAVWVSLAPAETTTALHDALAAACRLPTGAGPLATQLQGWLAGRDLLVVLDNVEQLLEHGDALPALQALVDAAPSVRWLATSRQALGLPIEHRIELAGLATRGDDAPALALLAEHAARHGVPLAPADHAAAARIADTLQGLPLALELAAGWLTVMSATEVADEVARDLGFLADPAGQRAPAQRSLRAVFDASWRRLDADQRQALAGLSVLVGAFDRQAAHDIARCPAPRLLGLAGRSLVQREAAGRFRLHPMVRQFAAEAIDADERDRLRRRHAWHFLERVAAPPALVPGDGDPARVAALLEWLPDIDAAWRRAVDARRFDWLARALPNLDGLLMLGGRLDEALDMGTLASAALPADDPLRRRLDSWRVASLVTLGRNAEGEALADELWRAGDALGHAERCTVAAAKTRLAMERGDHAEAERWALLALAAAEAAALPIARLRCLQNLGAVRFTRGDVDAAGRAFDEMLALAERHGADLQRARALRGLAVLAQMRDDPLQALNLLEACLGAFEALGDRAEIAQVHRSRSYVLRDLGRHREQRLAAEASVAIAEALGWPHQLAPCLFGLALAQEDDGDPASARTTYRRCLALARRHAMRPLVLRCLHGLAGLDADLGALPRVTALAVLLMVQAHPALRHGDATEVQRRIDRLAPDAAERAAAAEAASTLTPEEAGRRWLS